MKRRGIAALIAALAVIAAGLLISFFLSFSAGNKGQYQIILPGHGSATIDETQKIETENREKIQSVVIDKTNVQAVIASLSRPDGYSCVMQSTYFYNDESAELKSKCDVSGSLMRITQYTQSEKTELSALLTEKWVYLWNEGEIYERFPRMENDADLYLRAPSYRDIVLLAPEFVLDGGTAEIDGHLCLTIQTQDPETGETTDWAILADNGQLLYAESKDSHGMTFLTVMQSFSAGKPEDSLFLLPDGSNAS